MSFRVGSLFTGIGGFDLGFERAGWDCAWQVEIDPACQDVLARHWPEVTRYGDVREVGAANLEPVDAIVGGFPCQDISIAGRREGLDGKRSGLWWEFRRVLVELRPAWVVIENVRDLLSSNGGRDMGSILGALGDLGYGWAYRVLDAQWFGVPQRRRRVFIVGHLGDKRAAQVLLEPEGGGRDSPPIRTARKVAPTLFASGAGTARVASAGSEADFLVVDEPAPFDLTQITSRINRNRVEPGLPAPTLHTKGGGHVIVSGVRRFTPTECERLTGLPDGWTATGAGGNDIPENTRYRMGGNAVVATVAEWIAKRMLAATTTGQMK